MTVTSIPTIDIAPYLEGSEKERRQVADEINRICEEIGFFFIKGHGIQQTLIDRTYHKAAEFFRLPVKDKLSIRIPSPEIARGYTPFLGETLSAGLGNAAPADLKEMIDIGPVDVPDEPVHQAPAAYPHFAPNLWPERPAALRPTWQAYWRRLNRLSDRLMQCFALALDLPEEFFAEKLDRNISMFRVLNYPDQPTDPLPGQLRAGEHTDYGTLTILKSENAPGGLQVKNRRGAWVDVVAPQDSFVVNIGDLMMIWTNDRFVSTPHRVVNPPRDARLGTRRQSMPFFHQPNYDALIDTLPSCYGPKRPKKYEPMTYKDHWLGKWNATRKSAA